MRDSKGIKIKLETAKDQFDMVGDYDDRLPPDTLTGIPQLKTVDLPSMKGCHHIHVNSKSNQTFHCTQSSLETLSL